MKKKIIIWSVILVLAFVPIVLWTFTSKLVFPLSNFLTLSASLGELFGLVGIVMFSITIVLSVRSVWLANLFGSLNFLYKTHSLLGQISFILLLFHPLFLLARYVVSLSDASRFLFEGITWARLLGQIALWGMVFLIILTLYLRPKYNLWKITHKFLVLVLFLGALHVYLTPAYIMKNPILNIYILLFASVSFFVGLYQIVLVGVFRKKLIYIVDKLVLLSPYVLEVSLKPVDKKMDFVAGQFIFIKFKQVGLAFEGHPFSVSSSPDDNNLKITVKNLGDWTEELIRLLQTGAIAEIDGPYGNFSYNIKNKKQIWIAGGIGITPFLSMLKDIIKKKEDKEILFFYCVRNEKEAVYLNELRELTQKQERKITLIPFFSDQKGYVSAHKINIQVKNLILWDIFICAPPQMIASLRNGFVDFGIKKSQIHTEEFNF